MGRRAAKKAEKNASRAQSQELARANAASAKAEEEQKIENQRIFDATKPLEQSAGIQFGLTERGDMSSYSDFTDGATATNNGWDNPDFVPNFNATGGGLVTPVTQNEEPATPAFDFGKNGWFMKMFRQGKGGTVNYKGAANPFSEYDWLGARR